jgi:hypothetical protein
MHPVTIHFNRSINTTAQQKITRGRPQEGSLTLRETRAARARPAGERDVAPEVGRQLALLRGVAPSGRAVGLHPPWVLAVADIGMRITDNRG